MGDRPRAGAGWLHAGALWLKGLAMVCLLGLTGASGLAQPARGLLREVYEGIPGTSVGDLTGAAIYPGSPTATGYVTEFFEAPTDVLDNYGQRLRGYIVAPVTGNYTFWIASDDGGQLWLSTDDTPANRRQIAAVASWTPSREWTREAGQQSAPVALQAGRAYYVEALMKEGGGGDNLAVRWRRPDGVDEAPIPAVHLLPWGVAFKAPEIVREPRDATAVEGGTARFDIELDPLSPSRYQWRRNGSNLPGATNAVLEVGPVAIGDSGARYSVRLENDYGSRTSAEATLTVTPDVTPPTLVRVESRGPNAVRVTFSEPVSALTASNPAHFGITPGITVQSARAEADPRQVLLTTSALAFGSTYRLTVTGVTDRAATPNPVAPGSALDFVALEYTPSPVGGVDVAGAIERVGPGQFDVTGGGVPLSGGADAFQFAWEEREGDFDLHVRVADMVVTDAFLQAGLMARETLDPGARFGAALASSAQMGSHFASRSTPGGNAATTSIPGGFPVNGPHTWLRLRRTGPTLTGFGSLDGVAWTQLGTVTLSGLPSRLQVGLAVASAAPATAARVAFRDLGPTTSTQTAAFTSRREALGPVVRSSGLVISEIHYHPADNPSGHNLEFLEIYNAGAAFEDFTGYRLTGDVGYEFPDGFRLPAGAFVVVAADPARLASAHGLDPARVLGPFDGNLSNQGGTVTLRGLGGERLVEVTWDTDHPWPVAADGAGPSLVLTHPSHGPSNPRAWSASSRIGGSPGTVDPILPHVEVVINEWLAHTDLPQVDFVELYHPGAAALDLSGYVVTDDAAVARYRIPEGTEIGPRGHLLLDETALGFRLDATGERIFLISPDGSRVIDAVRFGPQENGVSSGRQPDGSPTFRRLAAPTPGAANAPWRQEDIVLNELMYNPISGDDRDEYVELHNRGTAAVDLSGWRFTSGISFEIPAGTVLSAGGHLVVAKDVARLRAGHPHLNAANSVGDYSGVLSNGGERVALARPDAVVTTTSLGATVTNWVHVVVAEVTYADGGRWGEWADGGGSSLELIDPDADPLRAANWADSDETDKGRWTTVEFTGRLDNGNNSFPPDQLQITLQGGGEALVDDVQVIRSGTQQNLVSNGGFESGSGTAATGWTFQGNHEESFVQTGGAAVGNRALHIRTQGRGDTGSNRIRTPLGAGLANNVVATIRARVKWIRGWPEILFRLRGNWLELGASLELPANLGTPGLANSRRVDNAGPALFDVTHTPALPQSGQPVLVTARVSDPDGIASVRAIARVDGTGSTFNVTLRDDGAAGDVVPGDGVYSGIISGRSAGTLVAFRVEARDGASPGVTALFPADAPVRECLVRWGDPIPAGTFGHYHMWSTAATESARNQRSALNNTYRDLTFVYGNDRVIYNAGFKDKGSPFHSGGGDFFIVTPSDDTLLGATDFVMASTGNGGDEPTHLREQTSYWIARNLGIGYLHRRYIRLYRNGGLFRQVMEDSEEPNGAYAERFTGDGPGGDLYKIEDWFEFQDNGTSFNHVDATLQRFTTLNNELKPARYRWSWRKRAVRGSANEFSNLLQLVETVNTQGSTYESTVLGAVDVDNWMRTFVFQRIIGNWDSYGFSRGKNMYAYRQDGVPWRMYSWDVDFSLGTGSGPTDGLWGAGDPTINRMYNTASFRRMLWQGYRDSVDGPLQADAAGEWIDALNAALRRNGVNPQDPAPVKQYIAARRAKILSDYTAADVGTFAITTGGGADITTTGSLVNLAGTAPLAVRTIAVNGVPYPVNWTGFTTWALTVPLTQVTNRLELVALDRTGAVMPGLSDTLQVISTGNLPRVEDFVVINEIQYHGTLPSSSFLELHNRSTTTPFDLSGFRLDGVGYTFPSGALIAPNGYLVLAGNRAGFAAAYGAGVPVFDVFPGNLDNDGERLSLVRPDPAGGAEETVVDEVRYGARAPWPVEADGSGPSLQLIDPAQDNWRVANWAVTAVGDPNQVTPGRANAVRGTLAAFPALWINEVLPENVGGPVDNQGEREPFVEIHNAGPVEVDLTGYHLTDDPAQPTRWPFPAGTILPSGGFLRVWADAEPGETAPGHLHAVFRPAPGAGMVALARPQGAGHAVFDHLEYSGILPGRSFGLLPDGQPRTRRVFQVVTPGAPNDPSVPEVRVAINEFLASNTATLADPADGRFDDWIELYNAGDELVDLSGYHLTDDLADPTRYRIPAGYSIPPGGFLLVWADDETAQNGPGVAGLHVNFRLSADGEDIGLFDPNGVLVDGFTFGPQTADVSVGRFPDGADAGLVPFDRPTPGEPNFLEGGNVPPMVGPIAARTVDEGVLLTFTAAASDPDAGQTLTFSLVDAPPGAGIDPDTGLFSWTPSEAQGPGQYTFAVRATDDGTPPRSGSAQVTLTVAEVNRAPVVASIADAEIGEGSLLTFDVSAEDPDLPANGLTFSLAGVVPDGAGIDEASGIFSWTPGEVHGPGVHEITVRVTDDGTPPLATDRTFRVTVAEVDNPPVLAVIEPQVIDEGDTLRVLVVAVDPDTPPVAIRYALGAGAPAGMTLDPATGVLEWTTTEDDGPETHVVSVTAVQNDGSGLSDTRSFGVTVREVNQAPVLAALPDLEFLEGDVVRFVATATDADRPAQTLTFTLAAGAPAGASIDPNTGEFLWAVPPQAGATTNDLEVVVTDSGPGNLTDSAPFRLVTRPRFRVVINEIMYRPSAANGGYVELLNASTTTPWDLSGIRLDGRDLEYVFPAGRVLAPGELVCVVADVAAFRAAHGPAPAVAGAWTGSLGAGGDVLRLVRPGTGGAPDEILDQVRYESVAPWPVAAAGGGAALQLVDALEDNDTPANWSAAASYDGPRELVSMTGTWRYYQEGPVGADWRSPAFDDASWSQGAALLYVENSDLPAPKNTALQIGQPTYYFRTRFTLPTVPGNATLQLSTIIDDGAVFHLNGREILRQNIATDAEVNFNTFASSVVDNALLVGPVTLPTAALVAGENVLAVEVHQVNAGSSDIVLGAELRLEGGTVVAFTPGAPNTGVRDLPDLPGLVLNEVHPMNTAGITDAAGEREPWIELHNRGPLPVVLDGWSLGNSLAAPDAFAFPADTVIPAGGFLVVFADGEPSESGPDGLHTPFRLDAAGGLVVLARDQPGGVAVVDYLRYGAASADRSLVPAGDDPARVGLDAEPTPWAPNRPAGPPPLVVVPEVTAEGITLAWPTVPGRRYRVDVAAGLDVAGWESLVELTADADGVSVDVGFDPDAEVRLYRVVELP